MSEESSQQRPAGMIFILITLFIDILGIGIIIPVLPELVKQFVGGSTAVAGHYVGLISGSYSLMQFLFAPMIGALSDKYGRRPVILAALFGFGVDFIIQGLASNLTWLFVGRLIAGVMGGSFSIANAYIADISLPENRARNYGLVGMMFGLGFIVGPPLGGILGEVNLRLPFFVAAGLALVNWIYGYFVLPESLPPERRSGLQLSKMNPFGSMKYLGTYPLVAALAPVFFFSSLAQRGLENVWVLFTAFQFGWDKWQNGLALGLVGLMAVIVQGGLMRPIVARFGERRCVLFGLVISILTFTGYGMAQSGSTVIGLIILGSLYGLVTPATQSLIAGTVSATDQGKVQGALTSLTSFTAVIAPVIFTTGLFSYFTSKKAPILLPGAPFLLGAVLFAAAFVIAWRAFRRFPSSHQDANS